MAGGPAGTSQIHAKWALAKSHILALGAFSCLPQITTYPVVPGQKGVSLSGQQLQSQPVL